MTFMELCAWSMTDREWQAAGCPPPYSVSYALAAAALMPDGGETLQRILRELANQNEKKS